MSDDCLLLSNYITPHRLTMTTTMSAKKTKSSDKRYQMINRVYNHENKTRRHKDKVVTLFSRQLTLTKMKKKISFSRSSSHKDKIFFCLHQLIACHVHDSFSTYVYATM